MLRRIAKNFGFLTIATVLSRIISFYVIIHLARTLGPEGFGKITIAQGIITYFTILTDLGLKTYATSEIAGKLSQARKLLNQIFSMRIFLAGLSFTICLVITQFLPIEKDTLSLVLGMSFLIITTGVMPDWIFLIREEMFWNGLNEIIQNLLWGTLIFIWIHSYNDLHLVPPAYIIGASGALIAALIVLRKKACLPRFVIDLKKFRTIFRLALPIGLSSIIITLYFNLGQIMLGFIKGPSDAGLYSAANRFLIVGNLGLSILLSSFYPALVKLHRKKTEVYYRCINLASRLLLPVGFGCAFFSFYHFR